MFIKSKRVWIANSFIPAIIEIEGKKIVRIYPYETAIAVDADYGNHRIVPGFIDIHTHGAYGVDTNDADYQGNKKWWSQIVEEGVTGICPTTVTQSVEVLTKALTCVSQVVADGYQGAEVLGINMEGPFLDETFKGAQPIQHLKKPNLELMQEFYQASNGLLKVVSIAPEYDEDLAVTAWLSAHGIVPSIGHSSADYQQVLMAVAHGAKSMTHVYNGMTPFNHRENGQVGAAYRIRDLYGEIIPDGIHSTPAAINIYFQNKGANYGVIVSDSLSAKYQPKGEYTLGGNKITIYDDGSAHRTDGGLAGSTLKMNEALRICVETALVPFDYALNACTINPARLLGVGDRKGKIAVHYDADLVVLDDQYQVLQTIVQGKNSW